MNTILRTEQLAAQHGLTLTALASKCGINRSTLSATKSRGGQLSVDTIEMICAGLGISLRDFFTISADR